MRKCLRSLHSLTDQPPPVPLKPFWPGRNHRADFQILLDIYSFFNFRLNELENMPTAPERETPKWWWNSFWAFLQPIGLAWADVQSLLNIMLTMIWWKMASIGQSKWGSPVPPSWGSIPDPRPSTCHSIGWAQMGPKLRGFALTWALLTVHLGRFK